MYVVDASVWVSRFIDFDSFHQPSLQWLQDRVSMAELVFAPAILLVETAGAVARRIGEPVEGLNAASLIEGMPYSRLVPMQSSLVQMSAQMAARRSLRGADALYVTLAMQLGMPLVTWDGEQKAQHRHGIIVLTPQEALTGG